MLILEEMLLEVKKYDSLLEELRDLCKIEAYEIELQEKERLMSFDDFWNDVENSQKILQEVKSIKDKINLFSDVHTCYEETMVLIEMALEEKEESLIDECKELYNTFLRQYNKVNMQSLYVGEYDSNDAIINIHAGAGGTESCDWVTILFRMYSRYASKNGLKLNVLDKLDGEEAGIKSITFEVSGEFSYGNLKGERGVHRLVRISPFDSSGRRHTSFAAVDVMPVIEDDDTIEINLDDLRIDTYRASGAGGQHINTTDSAIRITHLPTNIVVQCQNERSQHKNKDVAMKMLKGKLFEHQEMERKAKLKDIRGEVLQNAFGSQTRSYVFHPYNLVKDHITLEETGNINSVIDGDLDRFILGYLKWLNTSM